MKGDRHKSITNAQTYAQDALGLLHNIELQERKVENRVGKWKSILIMSNHHHTTVNQESRFFQKDLATLADNWFENCLKTVVDDKVGISDIMSHICSLKSNNEDPKAPFLLMIKRMFPNATSEQLQEIREGMLTMVEEEVKYHCHTLSPGDKQKSEMDQEEHSPMVRNNGERKRKRCEANTNSLDGYKKVKTIKNVVEKVQFMKELYDSTGGTTEGLNNTARVLFQNNLVRTMRCLDSCHAADIESFCGSLSKFSPKTYKCVQCEERSNN